MAKQEFKAKYSLFRKSLATNYHRGQDAFYQALNSDKFFKEIYFSRRETNPMSPRVYLHLTK
jgi:hypothetical protein